MMDKPTPDVDKPKTLPIAGRFPDDLKERLLDEITIYQRPSRRTSIELLTIIDSAEEPDG